MLWWPRPTSSFKVKEEEGVNSFLLQEVAARPSCPRRHCNLISPALHPPPTRLRLCVNGVRLYWHHTRSSGWARERCCFFLSYSPATFSKALADNGRLREEVQEVALEQQWCGVQLPGPCGPLGISTMKLRFLHGGRGPDLSYLPSASLQRDCWRAGEKEESRAGGKRWRKRRKRWRRSEGGRGRKTRR